jgi:hypothetical protein
MKHSNLFAGQNLPVDSGIFKAVDKGDLRLEEIDCVQDYIRINRRYRCI